tara:strand:- start:301 stop:735 length:435 start_codon:yes stop_codon:yes gene_type:complete
MEINEELKNEIKKTKTKIDSLMENLSEYDSLKGTVLDTNEKLIENLNNFSSSIGSIQDGAAQLSQVAESIQKLSESLAALDVSKINERLTNIEKENTSIKSSIEQINEGNSDLIKTIKKKMNKIEENLESKIKNSSLYSKVFNR